MSQIFKCQNLGCGVPVPAQNMQHHSRTGETYYTCPKCGAKNKVTLLPTPQGAPAQFTPSGVIAE